MQKLGYLLLMALVPACKETPPPASSTSATALPAAPTEPSVSATVAAASPSPEGGAALTIDDSGKKLDLSVGATFQVELRGSAGTGFKWDVTSPDSAVVALSGSATRAPLTPGMPGGPFRQTFVFVAKAPGTAHVELQYRRSFGEAAPAKTFFVDVTVK
jgi:predicted secreted protein